MMTWERLRLLESLYEKEGGGQGLVMRICFWNIRGLGGKGRWRQLRELLIKQRIDVICLQQIMKSHFSLADLRNLAGGRFFLGIGLLQEVIQGGGGSNRGEIG
jgi:hypothetical protein